MSEEHLSCGCPWGFPCGVVGPNNCTLCGRWLGRQTGKGTHFGCREHLKHATETLAENLRWAAALCAAFEMGRDAGPGPHVPFKTSWWRPGCGKPWSWPHMTRDEALAMTHARLQDGEGL